MTKRARLVVTVFVLTCVGAFSFAAWKYVSRDSEPPFATGKHKPSEFCASMAANVATAWELPVASEYIAASSERVLLEEWKGRFMSVNGLDETSFDSSVRVYSAEDRDATNGEHLGLVVEYVVVRDWYVVTGLDYLIVDEYTAAHPKAVDEISDLHVVFGAPSTTPVTCEEAIATLSVPNNGTVSIHVDFENDDIRLLGEGVRCMGPIFPTLYAAVSLISGEELYRTMKSEECAHLTD